MFTPLSLNITPRLILPVFLIMLKSLCIQAMDTQDIDLGQFFEAYGFNGCFILFDPLENRTIEYNSERCDSGYLPASTFKILNSLIALEEGVIRDTAQRIAWDGFEWPNAAWNSDQTLSSAVKSSCIWVFFTLAQQVGIPKYQEYIDSIGYGNRDLSGPPDRFWLVGELRITAREQIGFLNKFCSYDLPFSRENIDLVKHMITLEESPGYRLMGKTGAGSLGENLWIMWFVGCIEIEGCPYFFAMNFTTDDMTAAREARLVIIKNILAELDLIIHP